MSEKKRDARFTLTGKNIPADLYDILEQKSKERSITNYVVELMRKEELMDQLLPSLALMGGMNAMLQDIHKGNVQVVVNNQPAATKQEPVVEEVVEQKPEEKPSFDEIIIEGDINISDEISGGFEEDEMDF
ncbi:MAG: hypothetical protein ACI35P_01650 [Bacillus sp. (in: firmicutes)]